MPWSSNIAPIRKKKAKKKSDTRMSQPHQKFETDPEILKKQVVIETYRSRGPGGQRKNKTETAVRLKHLPSGITVVATEHRTQSQNLKQAFERLRMRLLRLNQPRKRRIPTSTPVKAYERRIEEKKVHSKVKRFRQRPLADSD
jgi:protein subunit release factor B